MLSHTLDKGDTIYVIVDGDKCKTNNHLITPTEIYLKLSIGKSLLLKGQYCWTCNQVQVSRNLWAENNYWHEYVLANEVLKGIDDSPFEFPEDDINYNYNPPERAQESQLKKYGYSVAWGNPLSNKERQVLLKKLIESGKVSKGYVISYLKHNIQINGKKESNEFAVSKWKDDLEFVYKL